MVVRLTGTIDGNPVVFKRMEEDWWQAAIPRKLNGIYIVSLTAYDDAGNISYCTKYVITIDVASLCVHLEPYPFTAELLEEYKSHICISPYYASLEESYYINAYLSDYYAEIM